MGTELPTKVMLGQTLVLMQMTFLNKVRKVGRLVLFRTSCFSLLSLKRKLRLMRSPACLSVCPPLITFEPIGRFYEIQSAGDATEGDLDAVLINLVTSTIPKWRTFKILRWMQNLHVNVGP
jgi:hypothetical protein